MIYRLEPLYENLLGNGYVVECYGAVFEEAVSHLLVNQLVYERADALRSVLRQRA